MTDGFQDSKAAAADSDLDADVVGFTIGIAFYRVFKAISTALQ